MAKMTNPTGIERDIIAPIGGGEKPIIDLINSANEMKTIRITRAMDNI